MPGHKIPIGNNIFPMNLHSATLSYTSFFSADKVLNPAIKKDPRPVNRTILNTTIIKPNPLEITNPTISPPVMNNPSEI